MSESPSVELFARGGLRLSLSSHPEPAAVELLCNTSWGSPGGIRYQHLDTRSHIFDVPNPVFLHLHKGEHLQGVLAMSDRPIKLADKASRASYVRYFAMRASIQRKEVASGSKHAEVREGLLKKVARKFLDSPDELRKLNTQASDAFYAYVILDNVRSLNMCESMGFTPVRTFRTHVFSRMFPKRAPNVRLIEQSERKTVSAQIEKTYESNGFWPEGEDWTAKDYWVAVEEGKVVAGLKVTPVHWRMQEMPGKLGRLLIRVLPRIPLLRRLVNPDRFDFLAVDALICDPGKEAVVFRILSHVCAAHGMYVAMIWRDELDKKWARILGAGRLGLLNRLNDSSPISVIVKGMAANDVKLAGSMPSYIWASDVI